MKRITFRADEKSIEGAREVAAAMGTTLNAAFREWLAAYVIESESRGTTVQLANDLKGPR